MQKKVLILDDDAMALFSLESILTNEGYLVNCIGSSDIVDLTIKAFVPDLIILDIRLKDGDGREICNKLKKTAGTRHIPIVMLTALSYDEIGEIECSADAIIGKSFDSENLLRTIADLLAG